MLKKLFSVNFVEPSIESLEAKIRNNKRLLDFYKRWRGLENLVSLKITASDAPEKAISIFNFAIYLLGNLSSSRLETFEFSSFEDYSWNLFSNKSVQKITEIDLSNVFVALQGVGRKLQSIIISLPSNYSITLKQPIAEDVTFADLTLLKISENSIWDINTVQNMLKMLKYVAHPLTISLDRVFVLSNQEFFVLLETLQRTPRNINIELEVPKYGLDMRSLDKTLKEFIEKAKLKRRVENVSLTVEGIGSKYPEVAALLSEIFGDKRRRLKGNKDQEEEEDLADEIDDDDENSLV